MLYLRNKSFSNSKLAAVRRYRLSVKTEPHTGKTLSLAVLVAGTDSNCPATSALLVFGSCDLCSFQNCWSTQKIYVKPSMYANLFGQ